jgi:phytoene synthase
MAASLQASSFDHCSELVRAADKDRFLASLFVPAGRRGALHALYAFDIEIAAVAARVREPLAGEVRLQWWRDVLEGRRSEEARANPVADALLRTVSEHRLPLELLVEAIDARAFDLYREPMRSPDQLETYARRTDGAIFAGAARVLGADAEPGLDHAALHAGAARTIAGVLRALPQHAARGQLYLPLDLLARHAVSPETVAARQPSPGLFAALDELRDAARQHHDAAVRLLGELPAQARAAFLPLALVPLQLDAMRASDPFAPAEPPQWRKQWRLWRSARNWLR